MMRRHDQRQTRSAVVISLGLLMSSILFCSVLARAQTVFQDDFTGTAIDPAKWGAVGGVSQNGKLIMNGSAPEWDACYAYSVPTFARTSGSNVLRVTMDADLNGLDLIGFIPEGSPTVWANLKTP